MERCCRTPLLVKHYSNKNNRTLKDFLIFIDINLFNRVLVEGKLSHLKITTAWRFVYLMLAHSSLNKDLNAPLLTSVNRDGSEYYTSLVVVFGIYLFRRMLDDGEKLLSGYHKDTLSLVRS